MSNVLLTVWLAGIYARVSRDKRRHTQRERASVDQQVQESRIDTDDLGSHEGRPIVVKDVYCDNDVSASRYATKVREDWPRFVSDIKRGAINFVIFWECSRGSREGVEWLTFLSLCRELGVPIRVVSHDRTYDVRNPRDWKTLADEGIDSEVESAKTSKRVKRDKAALRGNGRPDGPLAFGHRREYDPGTGELLRQVPDPVEAPIILELFDRFLAGEPFIAIAKDLNVRAELPRSDPKWAPLLRRGGKWNSNAVRRIMLNPAHIGKRTDPHTGDLLDCQWPPLSEDLPAKWWMAHRVLNDRARAKTNPGRVKHLLTRIMTCDVCGSVMARYVLQGTPRYYCSGVDASGVPGERKGCTTIVQTPTDEYVSRLVIGRLSQPDLLASAVVQDDATTVIAQAEADQLRARLQEAFAGLKRGVLTMDEYAELKMEIEPQVQAAEAAVRNCGVPPLLRSFTGLIGPSNAEVARELVAEMWAGFPVAGKRDVIRTLFSEVRLCRKVAGTGRAITPDRIGITWRTWE